MMNQFPIWPSFLDLSTLRTKKVASEKRKSRTLVLTNGKNWEKSTRYYFLNFVLDFFSKIVKAAKKTGGKIVFKLGQIVLHLFNNYWFYTTTINPYNRVISLFCF